MLARILGLANLVALIVVCLGAAERSSAADPEPSGAADNHWGTVTGRVVFDGALDDPLLDRFRGEIPVYDGARTLRAAAGLEPDRPDSFRKIGVEINRALLIDDSTRGVKNAFVYLRRAPAAIHPRFDEQPPDEVQIVSRHTRFIPRAGVTRVGRVVRFTNLSPHYPATFHTQGVFNMDVNTLVEPLQSSEWTPRRTERFPIRVQDDLTAIAQGWLLILDHPYAAVTAADGTFVIEDLPVGEHQLMFWHETVGYIEKNVKVTVAAGETVAMPDCSLTLEQVRAKHAN